jgi:hypothetical protein
MRMIKMIIAIAFMILFLMTLLLVHVIKLEEDLIELERDFDTFDF